jgi:hypothetical protein
MYHLPSELQIEITQDDIDQGERSRTTSCPIALAIARACQRAGYGEARPVVYDDSNGNIHIELHGPDGPLNADAYWPQGDAYDDLRSFLLNFDEGRDAPHPEHVHPMTATLRRL